jgi:hypothetical protein
MSETVKVYFCRISNGVTGGGGSLPPWKATADHINQIGRSVIPETEEEVDVALLDERGHYDPAQGDAIDDTITAAQVAAKPVRGQITD